VLEALEAAGARGVRLRVLLSAALLGEDRASYERLRRIAGAEVRVWDPPGGRGVLHAKYWVVDGRVVFVGSQNLDGRSLAHIHEIGVLAQNAALAARLGRIFEDDWRRAGKVAPDLAPLSSGGGEEIELVASPPHLNPPGVRPALARLVELIDGAQATLDVELLSYAPRRGHPIARALRRAARRGVRVRLAVADWSTGPRELRALRSLARRANAEVRVVSIPEARAGFIPYARVIHAKIMVVDGRRLWIGTSNWTPSYFSRSRNVELVVHRPALAALAVELFRRLWESPHASPLRLRGAYVPRRRR
jgi:phosphatidylserine/phosphatidylglycerophosphate/cardiolipin synthase-like enzyme